MKPREPFDSTTHAQMSLLLPWYLNGTLEVDELREVEAHLKRCLTCRRELQQLSLLQERWRRIPAADLPTDIHLQRFWSRFSPPRESRFPHYFRRLLQLAPRQLMFPVALALSVMVLVLPSLFASGWLSWKDTLPSHTRVNSYRTLSSATRYQPGDVRVIFTGTVKPAQLQHWLNNQPYPAEILEGRPMIHNHSVYVLRTGETADLDRILPQLRQLPKVILAEPVIPTAEPQPAASGGVS